MDCTNELKAELGTLMHDLIKIDEQLLSSGKYQSMVDLCKQDIAIISLIEHSEDITARKISMQLDVSKTTIVSAVRRLVERGYIGQIENVMDKREKRLVLTEKGKEANREHIAYEEATLDIIISMWKKEDREILWKLLKRREENKIG